MHENGGGGRRCSIPSLIRPIARSNDITLKQLLAALFKKTNHNSLIGMFSFHQPRKTSSRH